MKNRKRYIRNIIYCMAVTLVYSSVSSAAAKFTLSRSNVNVTEGNKISVKYSAPGKVKVKSSKKRTAKASIKRKYIVIKGVQPGTAVIKVTYKRKIKSIKVNVKKKNSVLSSSLQMKANAPSSCQPVGNIFPNGDGSNNNDMLFDTEVTSKPKPTRTPSVDTPPANTPAATYPPMKATSSPEPFHPGTDETPTASPTPGCQSTAEPTISPESTPSVIQPDDITDNL